MSCLSPPEMILFEYLVCLEFISNSPPFIIGKDMSVLLEEGINSRNTSVPRILQIFQAKLSVLFHSFSSLCCVFGPYTLRINEFRLPRLEISVEIRNELTFIVTHTRTEVRNTCICLFRVFEIRLRNENMTH